MDRRFIAWGGALGFLAVGLGAFGTHGLRSALDPSIREARLATWETAVHYQLAHALALLLVALIVPQLPQSRLTGNLFLTGIFVFSGSLYLYVLLNITAFAIITPLGGLFFLGGWAWLVFSALQRAQ